MGAKQKNNGYGRLRVNGKNHMAHRWAWEKVNGPIPEGLTIDHLCFNRACIEPAHMRIVTRAANGARHKPGCMCNAHYILSDPTAKSPLLGRAQTRGNTGNADVCGKGHDLTAPGSRTSPKKGRHTGECRACAAERYKRYAQKKKTNLAPGADSLPDR